MIVVLIVADSLKASAPGFAGGGANTPFMDRLAKEGTHFENMFASGAWTVPSVMSMLTGTLGHKIGVCRWRHPFPAFRPTLFTAFQAAGFEVSCFHPYPHWGLLTVPGRGFAGNSQDPQAVMKALRGRKGQDRFIFILHWWTHLPYVNHELSRSNWHAACDFSIDSLNRHPDRIAQKLEENYLQSVSYFSENILPKYLEAATANGEDALFAITGDHGETWGRSLPEGRKVEIVYDLHGRWITDETIKVPFLLHGKTTQKSVPGNQGLGGFASGVDIGPTIADLAKVPWPGPVPENPGPGRIDRGEERLDIIGQSLAECVMHNKPAPRQEVLTVSSHNTHEPKTYPSDGKAMWRTMALRNKESWFVWDGVKQERTITPVKEDAIPDKEEADSIFTRLEKYRQEAIDSAPMVEDEHLPKLRGEDDVIKRKLRSLGYLD